MSKSTLFELSFEVANKIGGIYTVLSSKNKLVQSRMNKYITLGPYLHNKHDFKPLKNTEVINKLQDSLNKEGIKIHYGEWTIPGSPKCILIDFKNLFSKVNDYKAYYYEKFGIESHQEGYDFEEPLLHATATGILVEKYQEITKENITLHSHEWMSGFANLYTKDNKKIRTVFTTHATIIGRSMVGSGEKLYQVQDQTDGYTKAKELGILGKYTSENAMLKNSDFSTTVSEITKQEVHHLHGVEVKVVANGLDIATTPTYTQNLKTANSSKSKLLSVLNATTPDTISSPDENIILGFTSGRYEYRSKGLDYILNTLQKLNEKIKKTNSNKTIAFYFLLAIPGSKPNGLITNNLLKLQKEKEYISKEIENQKESLVKQTLAGKKEIKFSFNNENSHKLNLNQARNTHTNIDPYFEDELNKRGLTNKKEDKVKIIYSPAYLDGDDGIYNTTYEDIITGMDIAVFPSYYEPYGYTPLESISQGIPTITTDYAGFGKYMEKYTNQGLQVLKQVKPEDDKLLKAFTEFIGSSERKKDEDKIKAKLLAKKCDWKNIITGYIDNY